MANFIVTTVRVPEFYVAAMRRLVEEGRYSSMSKIVVTALERLLAKFREPSPPPVPAEVADEAIKLDRFRAVPLTVLSENREDAVDICVYLGGWLLYFNGYTYCAWS
jgi:Predicted transcriptional regulators containing the CopG/Arc/MetJ DNA-binding domain